MSHRPTDHTPPSTDERFLSRRERREAEEARLLAAGASTEPAAHPEALAEPNEGHTVVDDGAGSDEVYVDEHGRPVDEHGQPVQYVDEHGQPIQYVDEHGQPVHYVDENGLPVHYVDENGSPVHFVDEHGQPVDEHGRPLRPVVPAAGMAGHHEDELIGATAKGKRRPSKKVRRRRRAVALLVVLAMFVAVTFLVAQLISPLLATKSDADFPGPGHDTVNFQIAQGAATRAVAADLVKQGVVASDTAFLSALGNGQLHPGEFKLKKEMKAADAVSVLLDKDAAKTKYAAVATGLRINEVFTALSQSLGIPVAEFQAAAKTPSSFGLPAKAPSLEGYLAPGEYNFPLDVKAKDVLATMVKKTQDELSADGVTDPNKQYEILTLASIIQAEAGPADYATVSGAIRNRLAPNNSETGGFIQSDATVTYGLNRKSYEISDDEKKDASNRYNTYANPGLPVGPIGAPGAKAVDAAAKPKDVPYYYWVTVNLDTGETKFAKTLAEHNQNVAEYQSWCSTQKPGRCQ